MDREGMATMPAPQLTEGGQWAGAGRAGQGSHDEPLEEKAQSVRAFL